MPQPQSVHIIGLVKARYQLKAHLQTDSHVVMEMQIAAAPDQHMRMEKPQYCGSGGRKLRRTSRYYKKQV